MVQNANVHQLVAMKAYVLELDGKIQSVLEQNAHLQKRNAHYKEKYQDAISENREISDKFGIIV